MPSLARRSYARHQERWPKGHPLGGAFKPKGVPATASPAWLAASMVRAGLTSPTPLIAPGKAMAIASTLEVHAALLVEAIARKYGPEVAYRVANHPVVWGDFGDAPLNAWYDMTRGVIVLNPRIQDPRKALRVYIHELTHVLDHSLDAKGKLARNFAALHSFLQGLVERGGTIPHAIHVSRLAYPLTGWYGLVTDKALLKEEYPAVVSELVLAEPVVAAQFEAWLRRHGYDGPSLKELVEDIWGVRLPPFRDVAYPPEWDAPVDPRVYGGRRWTWTWTQE